MHKIIIFCSLLAIILSDPTCKDGEYLGDQSSAKVCKGCPAYCTKCDNVDTCTECSEAYFLYTNGGKTVCEKNTSLTANCAASTDKEKCTACLTGYFLDSTSSNCVKSDFGEKCSEWEKADTEKCTTAASGYYLADGTPTACGSNCDACTSATVCTTCKSGFYKLANNTCKAVSAVCKTWKSQDTEACATCEPGFQAIGNKCYNDQCKCTGATGPYPACGTACADANCAECPTATNVCSVCNINYLVHNGECVNKAGCKTLNTAGDTCTACLDGYFFSSSAGTCTGCSDTNCKECSVAAATCAKCNDEFFLLSNVCTGCAAHCKTCSDASTCSVAMEGYLVVSNAPVVCSVANCATCSPAATCTTCKAGYYLNNNECTVCFTNCAACTGKKVCTACAAGYFLDDQDPDNTQCVACAQAEFKAYCSTSQWTKEFWECKDLTGNCATNEVSPLTGAGETTQQCKSCKAGYYLKDDLTCTACSITNCDQCIKDKCLDCSDNYFLSDDLASCKACLSNCKRCNADDACLECVTGYTLKSTSECEKSDSTDGTDGTDGDGASIISLGSIFLLALLILW